jgi:anti-sigma B factor antagonist
MEEAVVAQELIGRVTTVVRWSGHEVVVRVAGEVDLLTAPHLEDVVTEALREAPEVAVIDLSEVAFLGAAGLSVLIRAHLRGRPGSVRVVASDRPTLRPLRVTGLTSFLAIYPSREEALSGSLTRQVPPPRHAAT